MLSCLRSGIVYIICTPLLPVNSNLDHLIEKGKGFSNPPILPFSHSPIPIPHLVTDSHCAGFPVIHL